MEPTSAAFDLQADFPAVIISYCSKTDGGRGEQRMWQIANFLKQHGIASFNGKQVRTGEDWMQKWLGKMPESDVCLALLGPDYFTSGPCKEELYATAREGIPILPIIFETPPPLKKGFFGTSVDDREKGNFVKTKLGNYLPTPDQGLFQDNWETNLAALLAEVKKHVSADNIGPPEHDVAADVAKMSIAAPALEGGGAAEVARREEEAARAEAVERSRREAAAERAAAKAAAAEKAAAEALPGGYKVGDKVYNLRVADETFANGDRLTHGALGEVTGPVVNTSSALHGKGVQVKFSGNQLDNECSLTTISKTLPQLPGGYKVGDKVFYAAHEQSFSNGDRIVNGAEGEVTGPVPDGSTAEGKGVTVLFTGNKLGAQCFLDQISRLPGGYTVGDKVYHVATGEIFSNGDRMLYGSTGEVTGPVAAGGQPAGGVVVLFQGNKLGVNCYLQSISKAPPPPLPGGYTGGSRVVHIGASEKFSNGDRLTYGSVGVVTGPVPATSTAVGKGVTVMFAGNKLGVQSFVVNLADVKVTYTGTSQTFSNGDRLDHGAEGEVTGPVPDGSPAEGKGMTVLFPGNKLGAQLFVSDLDLTMRSCMEEVD